MPWGGESKPAKHRKSVGPFKVNTTERFLAPDRVDKVTIKAFGKNRTVWHAAPKCPKCDTKLNSSKRCPDATGSRKYCR